MDPMVVEYIGFVVAALILAWAIVILNRRYFSRWRQGAGPWIKFDSTRPGDVKVEELLPGEDNESDQKDIPGPDIHTRAKQNGHYSEITKPL
jgi:hypothetical protein